MNASTNQATNNALRELVITRVFDAPRELVWKAWTEPERVKQWWSPNMFTTPVCEVDARAGGAIYIVMRGPDGVDYPMKGVFQEVVKPERLVFTSIPLEDAEGNVQMEVLTTVTLEEEDGKTRLTMKAVVTKATAEAAGPLAGMEIGWNQTLDKLAAYLRR